MDETKLPVEMPSLLGAGSAFIPVEGLPTYGNDVLQLDQLTADTTLVGYVFGGISSPNPNVFMTMMGGNGTTATNQVFKVYLIQGAATAIDQPNAQSMGALHMQVSPNPGNGDLLVRFSLAMQEDVRVAITSETGALVHVLAFPGLQAGEHTQVVSAATELAPGAYLVRISTQTESAVQRIIIR